ncbi:MAG TPA: TIGR00269 family protein [Candidatus Nanoarchaeia archaeon]|nr:TIGR00269 family protein [Candidatus Nanoarchaeia archaeon]
MTCKNCSIKPVYSQISGVKLCRSCFIKYFEKKVIKTIKKYNLIQNNDKIAVAVSGGKDSLSLLYLLDKYAKKYKNQKLIAILIDEGIETYRPKTIEDAKKLAKELDIELKIYSFKDEFSKPLDKILKELKENACSVCGTFRRYLLNKYARKLDVTKLATGHNLDDEAQSILMNQFKGNIEVSARLGPITGIIKDKKFIPRIKPLYFMTEKETAIYSYLKGFTSKFIECPNSYDSYRDEVRNLLNSLEVKYPGIKYSIVNSFLVTLPLLKDHYSKSRKMEYCSKCNEPCSGTICKACRIIEKIKN